LEKLNQISSEFSFDNKFLFKVGQGPLNKSPQGGKTGSVSSSVLQLLSFSLRFTINKTTGIGEDNYEVEACLKTHIPEILPINGIRLHVSYLGQLKQCRHCFGQGHIQAICEKEKIDWLEYVATLHKSGLFRVDLFDGWMPTLKQYHSSYQEPGASDLRQVLDFHKTGIARNNNNRQDSNSSQQNPTQPEQNQQQGVFNFNSNNGHNKFNNRGRGRGFRGQRPFNNRGRSRGRGYQSSNYLSSYN